MLRRTFTLTFDDSPVLVGVTSFIKKRPLGGKTDIKRMLYLSNYSLSDTRSKVPVFFFVNEIQQYGELELYGRTHEKS